VDREIFEELIEEAVAEITGRRSDYFSRYPVDIPALDYLVDECLKRQGFSRYSEIECLKAIKTGMTLLEKRGVPVRESSAPQDAISKLLIDSVLDAYSAARGDIPLSPISKPVQSTSDSVSESYTVNYTRNGICHVLPRQSGRVLLLVSSTGVPLAAWAHLLEDRHLNRRCMVVQSRCGPLLEGGTPHRSCLWDDVSDIKSALRELEVGDIDLLGWCDGSRVAIELARSMPSQIGSLILLAPTFHGTVDGKQYPSPFEDSLFALSALLGQDSSYDRYLLKSVSQPLLVNLDELKDNTQKRANAVLRLPPHTHIENILMPLSTVEYFRNYVYRLTRDDGYDARAAVAEIACPILMVNGTHDTAVNTQAARDVLTQSGRDVLSVTVSGAGHHIHLLQYRYLSYALRCFLSGGSPANAARLCVERLAGVEHRR
jgi:pimeloyl-ACP methyl ester carboxylesterase